ncbi:MAG: peptidylprolyl isomerase [Pseudomonadota bacterium]
MRLMRKNAFFRFQTACCGALACFSLSQPAVAQLSPSDVRQPVASGPTENIPPTYKGPSSSVAAVVNDSVITTYDVEQRMRLMVISSGGRMTRELLAQLETQALRDLVQEKLKLLEAKEFELDVEDQEIDGEIKAIANQGGMTPTQLQEVLAQGGVSIGSLREQIRANIAWPRLVQGRFRSRVRVNDDEVEQTLTRMREDATQEQFLVSEICIPVADRSQIEQYYQGALQLIEQMRRGVPFAVVAQQFSACTSAASGGDLGWVRAGELAPELDTAIKELPQGAVTNPIPSDGAFIIMAVRDKREAVKKGEESFTFAYAGAPLSLGRSAARAALEQLPTSGACNLNSGVQRQDLGKQVGVAVLENITIGDVDDRFRGAVEDLGRHEMSPIVEADDALHAVYVCEKDEGLGLPSRSAVNDRLFSRQLGRISQQYLRDVERDALVDIRIRSAGGPIAARRPSAG